LRVRSDEKSVSIGQTVYSPQLLKQIRSHFQMEGSGENWGVPINLIE